MNFFILIGLLLFSHAVSAQFIYAVKHQQPAFAEDEFVGPLSSWTDVKASCGAAGNSSTNDTAAIQTCFNGLSPSAPTVYFPAGTYPVGLTATASAAASANSLTSVSPTTGIVAGEVVTGGGLPDGTVVGPTYTTGPTVPLVCQTPPCTGSGFSGATVGFSPSIHAQQYINIIGFDTGAVIWKYVGPAGGSMLYLNGVGVSLFSRMTLDGQNIAALVVDQSWYGTGNYADSGNQYSDIIFKNAATGFQCGILTQQCSETVMLRDQFLNFTDAGAHIWNFNALDTFFWYCLFEGNRYAISNNPGAGAFHAYNSIFKNQTTRDIELGNDGVYSFRYNYAAGTPIFLVREPSGGVTAVTLQGNTILEAEGPYIGTQGPLIMLNNSINAGACLAAFSGTNGFAPSGNIFSINNTYTGALTSSCATSSGAGTFHSFGDAVVGTVTGNPPQLPVNGTVGYPTSPPNRSRAIFDVTPTNTSADAGNIRTAITNAIAAGSKSVVHLKPGPFSINSTVQVPISDIQIIGDGNYSQLNWSGSGAGPVLQLLGPGSKVTLLNFAVFGTSNITNGIEIDGLDQVGSQVYAEQLNPTQSITNLFVDALDNTKVELHNFYPSFGALVTTTPAVVVTGGPQASIGNWLGGATNIFGGAYSGNYINFGVSSGGHLVNRDTWNDICCGQIQEAAISGPSVFTYSGAAIHLTGGSTAINFNNLTGIGAVVGVGDDGGGTITTTGASGPNAKVLSLGVLGPSSSFFTDTSSPAATSEFLAGFNSTTLLSETSANQSFLNAALAQLLTSAPSPRKETDRGVSDVGIYRVSVQNALTAVHLKN